jgi:hypothetical protein
MRSILRIVALTLVLLVLLVPLAAYAADGPCPDDPELSLSCKPDAPPYYVVVNRTFERLGSQYGTGCVPWILNHPDCTECGSTQPDCQAAAIDVERDACGWCARGRPSVRDVLRLPLIRSRWYLDVPGASLAEKPDLGCLGMPRVQRLDCGPTAARHGR